MVCKQANADDFTDEMGENPLGDRRALKTVGPFVIELYGRPIMTQKRIEEGKPIQGVVSVWEDTAVTGTDNWRRYKDVGSFWFNEERARAEFTGLRSPAGVKTFVGEHGEGI